MILDKTDGYLDEVKSSPQAKAITGKNSLDKALEYLGSYGDRETLCVLYKDWAPLSFAFDMQVKDPVTGAFGPWFNGGLIFHGDHDGGGNGGGPTLSVCLQPTDGWSIHT